MAAKKYVQSQTLYLAGSGALVAATSIVLTSLTDIYGNAITSITAFGDKGYITLEPDTSNEEGATFTSVTANANGTVTLGGVSTILAQSPYTETSGLARAHSGGTKVVITDNVAFWSTFGNINNQNTWADIQTFSVPAVQVTNPTGSTQVANKAYVDGVAIAGAPDSSTTVKGIGKVSVAPTAPTSPIFVGDNDPRIAPNSYLASTGSANAYVLTLAVAPASYVAGQIYSFKANFSNTGTATLNVNALGAKTINKVDGASALVSNDIVSGQVAIVQYDGTNFQLLSPGGNPKVSQTGIELYAVDGGSANTYTATLAPIPVAYVAGLTARVKISNTSTGPATLNVNGLGAKAIKKIDGTVAITKGDLVAGCTYTFIYDGTNFVVQVPLQFVNGNLNIAGNSGANVITTGFMPRVIRFAWAYISGGTGTLLSLGGQATYVNGNSFGVGSLNNAGSGSGATGSVGLFTLIGGTQTGTAGAFTGTVGTFTDTGFTLTMANGTSASPASVVIIWEAQS